MEWSQLFNEYNLPTFQDIEAFIGNSLWSELTAYIKDNYHISPKLSYSKCSMQKGWNVKYHKGGKSLCTLYPMSGYFISLIVIGNPEMTEAEFLIPSCSESVQNLYHNTRYSSGTKWMMIPVTDKQVLEDVKRLINLRVKPK